MQGKQQQIPPVLPQPMQCPGCKEGLPIQLSPGGFQAFHHNYEQPVLQCVGWTGTDTH